MKNVLVICNYKAGRKTAVLNKKKLKKFLFKNAEKFKILDICSDREIDVTDYDTIIAMGGDGTINQVVPYLINTNKTLGIIPCGTANLLAAKLGIPTNLKKALKILKQGKTKKIDAIDINGKPCVLRLGLGYDADIICKTPQSLKNKFGYFSYFLAGILFALRLKPHEYKISVNNKSIDVTATCIIVANAANMYQNIVSVGNKSKLNDGLMEVFVLKARNPITYFIEFLKILFNHKKNNPFALYFKTDNLKISNHYSLGHIDGEKLKFRDDIHLEILHNALNIYSK